MDFVYHLFVLAHLVGMAALVGGYLVTVRRPAWNAAMLWGARLQILTGLVLVGMLEMGAGDGTPNHLKIGVKLLVALAVVALAEVGSRRQPGNTTLVNAAGALALVDVAVAVLW